MTMNNPRASTKIVFMQHMFGLGGIDRVGCLLADGFAQAGFEVDLLLFCEGGPAEDALRPLIGDKVQISYLGRRAGSRTQDLIRLLPKAAGWLKRRQPDCVISTANNMNWITAASVRVAGAHDTKIVFKTTNPIIRERDGRFYAAMRKALYLKAFKAADRTLTLSDAETHALRSAFPSVAEKFQTVINPYVTEEMLAAPANNVPHDEQKIILNVGRFEPQKRMDLLIDAFAQTTTPDTRLVILGDGPQKAACEALVRRYNLEDRVMMPGFVSDISSWLHAADLFVLSSIYEGLPAVVLEAMAANCPVLSTDCFPAARDLVGGAEGCAIIEPATPAEMAAMIDAHLAQPRPASLSAIAEGYSIRNGIGSHIAHVERVLARD